jgi:hypothetical protein
MSFAAEAVAVDLFDHDELALVERAMAALTLRAPHDAEVLQRLIKQLRSAQMLLEESRPLRVPTSLGGEARTESTLVEHLISLDGLAGDLALPLKANLSRTYLLTKINFLRGFVKATTALEANWPEFHDLSHDLREELGQSIYTLLGEELFLALLRKRDVEVHTKRRAADKLITVWDDAHLEIDDFAPLLESAWHARNRINSDFGCLVGAAETFRLVCEDCSPEVLDYFAQDGRSSDESAAFEEFLFNMTYEELTQLRRTMREQGLTAVSAKWASGVLGRPLEELEHSHEIDPIALYRSYNRRQLATDFRLMSGGPGPRRTAEAYLMVHLLDQQS